MEDYKEKLKEALNSDNTDYEVVRWIEQNFPELKESEDEKIRNFLIDFIKVCSWTERKDQGWPLREECIAWLEKQGEKKLLNNEQYQTIPIETLDRLYAAEKELAQLKQKVEPKFKIGDTVWLKTNTHEYTKTIHDMDDECYIFNDGRILTFNCQDDWELVEQKPADADLKDIVDNEANAIWKEINTGGSHSIIDSFNQFYGICMQVAEAVVDCKKPTEWIQELESKLSNATPEQLAEWKEKYFKVEPAWSEEDKKMSRFIGNAITADGASEYLESKGLQVIDAHVWLDELKDRVQPQPKQEWSEKDEVALDDALWCCKQAASIAKDENDMGNVWYAENWLKSLKDRVQPQPKQAWSGGDEAHLHSLVTHLEQWIEKHPNTTGADIQGENVAWLKSLRLQPIWKPSAEQMTQLKRYCPDNRPLTSLYEQLKKLKE